MHAATMSPKAPKKAFVFPQVGAMGPVEAGPNNVPAEGTQVGVQPPIEQPVKAPQPTPAGPK